MAVIHCCCPAGPLRPAMRERLQEVGFEGSGREPAMAPWRHGGRMATRPALNADDDSLAAQGLNQALPTWK
jgi:hypothetical protein